MSLCIVVKIGFRDTKHLGTASGLAVITFMLATTCLMSLVIILCWHKSALLVLFFFILCFGSKEALYFSASLIKFREGAWVPLVLAFIFMFVMYVWHYGTSKKYDFDLQNKVSMKWLLGLGPSLRIVRVPGIGLIHTELVTRIPAILHIL